MDHTETAKFHEDRITRLESRVNEVSNTLMGLKHELHINTTATQGIKTDTDEIVSMLKGLKVLSRLGAWAVGVAGLVGLLKLAFDWLKQ